MRGDNYRQCKKCGRLLPLEAFSKIRGRHRHTCKDCRAEEARQLYRRRRAEEQCEVWYTCECCGRMLPARDFKRSAWMPDGHHTWCKACQARYRALYPDTLPEIVRQR
jgi:hypothetical protein